MDVSSRINVINHKYYERTAKDFSLTRQRNWAGWDRAIRYIDFNNKDVFNVLDVGCGNCRFAKFLSSKHPRVKFSYHGIDYSQKLLDECVSMLNESNIIYKEIICDDFLKTDYLRNKSFDLIAVFGITHHIYNPEERKVLLNNLIGKLNSGGLLLINFWNPGVSIKNKLIKQIDKFNLNLINNNDFFLENKKTKTFRYIHIYSASEIDQLFESFESQLILVDRFVQKEGNSENQYLVYKLDKI